MPFAKNPIMMQKTDKDKKVELTEYTFFLFAGNAEGWTMFLGNILNLHLNCEIIEHENVNATGKSCPVAFFQFEPSPYKAKSKSIPKSKGSRQNRIVSKTAFI